MKRIQLNVIAPFDNEFTEHTGEHFIDFAIKVLQKALEGKSIKFAERDQYNALIELNDNDNPIPVGDLYDFLYDQLGIKDHEGAFLSIYNYNPGFDFSSLSFGGGAKQIDLDKANQIRDQLNEMVIGQRHVIDKLINGYINSRCFVNDESIKPAQTYLFCGPACSGKTMVAEAYAKLLGKPSISFNSPDYLNERQIGRLFGFINQNPSGIIIFNEFENFVGEFVPLIFNVYLTGRYNGVDFKNTTIFFTTTGGSSIYLDGGLVSFASLSNEEIISSLRNERTDDGALKYNYYFLDILAKENVAMFNVLDYFSIHQIIAKHLEKHATNFTNKTGVYIKADYGELARFAMYSNVEEHNLNSLKAFAENILNEQVNYLAKNIEPKSGHSYLSLVKNIEISLPKKNLNHKVAELLKIEPLDVLVVADNESLDFIKEIKIDNANYVIAHGKNDALAKMKEGIDVVVIDPTHSVRANASAIDVEDYNSVGNDIFNDLIKYYHQVPIYLLSKKEKDLPLSAYQTLLLKGAKDVVVLDKEHPEFFAITMIKALANADLEFDIKLLKREQLKLECNPVQKLVKNKAGTYDARVVLDNLSLVKTFNGEYDEEEFELRNINGFDDVIGYKIAKETLKKYGRYLSHPNQYLQEGLLVPKGIILYSPGYHNLGKTALVKALSKETGSTIIKVNGKKALVESNGLDQLVAKIRDAFKKARRNAPAIVHITDINIVLTPADNPYNDRIYSLLRNEIEYAASDTSHPILFIGECSCDYAITDKLKELGLRFIMLEIPTLKDKEEFIKRYLSKHHIEGISAETVKSFAARCYYDDYKELSNQLDFAVHYAQGQELTDKILSESLDVYTQGDISNRVRDTRSELATAYHEMGHYLAMRLFGQKPPFVTIVARGYYLGYTAFAVDDIITDKNKMSYLNDICVDFAGRAAEVVAFGEEAGINSGISGDIRNATYRAKLMITKCAMGEDNLAFISDYDLTSENSLIYNEINKILREQYARAIEILTKNRKNLDKLSKALFEKKSIIGADLEKLVPDKDLIK